MCIIVIRVDAQGEQADIHSPRTTLAHAAGSGDLRVVRRGSRSVVQRAFARSPLRLLTPRNHGHAAWIFSSTYGGGLVGGDSISLTVAVERGGTALLQSQASTKVYRSAGGVTSSLRAAVEGDALLAVLPDPVVCFAGSAYRQVQTVDLCSDADLVLMDWMTSGRRASGERWQFDSYESRITVRRDTRLLLLDALRLRSSDGPLAERMARFECLAMLLVIGAALRSHAHAAIDAVGRRPLEQRADLLMAAAPLGEDGCIIRIAGVSAEAVGRAARSCLSFVPGLLNDDPWARKW